MGDSSIRRRRKNSMLKFVKKELVDGKQIKTIPTV